MFSGVVFPAYLFLLIQQIYHYFAHIAFKTMQAMKFNPFTGTLFNECLAIFPIFQYSEINVNRAYVWMSNVFEEGSEFDSEPVTMCPGRDSFLHASLVPDGTWMKDFTCLAVKMNRILEYDQYLLREDCDKVTELNWRGDTVKYMLSICLRDY